MCQRPAQPYDLQAAKEQLPEPSTYWSLLKGGPNWKLLLLFVCRRSATRSSNAICVRGRHGPSMFPLREESQHLSSASAQALSLMSGHCPSKQLWWREGANHLLRRVACQVTGVAPDDDDAELQRRYYPQ